MPNDNNRISGPGYPNMQRYRSIDIMRGMAIILMIQVHFTDNLSSRGGSSEWLYISSMLLGSLPAPLFAFVSGLSYCLWMRKQESLRLKDKHITRITLRRGLFLFVLGIVFNFCIWLPEETFNWDILTLLGTGLLFLAVARKLPAPVLALICVMVVVVSPLLRVVGDFSTYWEDSAYTYDFTFHDVLFGFFANGYFPVFPWIIFPIAGFICGDVLFRRPNRQDSARWWLGTWGIGLLVMAGVSMAFGKYLPSSISQHYASGLSEFPASTEFVLLMLGITLITLVLLNRRLDHKSDDPHDGRFITILSRFSTFSLTVYVFHHMVILWPLWIYGVCMGQDDPTFYWREAMCAHYGMFAVFWALMCGGIRLLR